MNNDKEYKKEIDLLKEIIKNQKIMIDNLGIIIKNLKQQSKIRKDFLDHCVGVEVTQEMIDKLFPGETEEENEEIVESED